MALRKTMPTRDPKQAVPENPHSHAYSGRDGGHVPAGPKPVPGTPKKG
ncbi:hypothetical protein [Streptomyces sp. H27-C3]|nr:hypothetical protein [Streptomyces sp. H27-C3]MDJ0461571.1 hypothetical protein [Streptomyces sp. H27-C3]